jgi:hypothetical protein
MATPVTIARAIEEQQGHVSVLARAKQIASERVKAAQRRIVRGKVEALRPQHLENVRCVAECLIALSVALEAEERHRARLPPGATGLVSGGFPNIGWLSNPDSPVRHWLRRVQEHGLLPADFNHKTARAALAAE